MPTVRSTSTTDFTQLSNKILMDGSISVTARLVWSVGMAHVSNWTFRRDDLMKKCGVSVNVLLKAIQELRERGLVTGEFRSSESPLTFYDTPNVQNMNVQNMNVDDQNVQNMNVDDQNVQNMNVDDEGSESERSEYERSTFRIRTINVQNMNANNIKNNIKTKLSEERELSDSAFNAPEAKSENLSLTLKAGECVQEDEPFQPENSPPAFEVQAWNAFVRQWNAAGLPKYTAFQPSSMDIVNFHSLIRRYGRDGPRLLCEQSRDSPWLRQQHWSLSWSLREDLATKIIDGQYKNNHSRTRGNENVHKIPEDIDISKLVHVFSPPR